MQLAWPFGRLCGRGDCGTGWIGAWLAVTNLQWVSATLFYSLYNRSSSFYNRSPSFTGLRTAFQLFRWRIIAPTLTRRDLRPLFFRSRFSFGARSVTKDAPSVRLSKYLPRYHAIRYVLRRYFSQFLDSFANLRKATISFVMPVRPIVRMEQLGSHWTDFHEIWYFSIFRISVEKTEVLLKSDKNSGYFIWSSKLISNHISFNSS
jgi:hypothetical protein